MRYGDLLEVQEYHVSEAEVTQYCRSVSHVI